MKNIIKTVKENYDITFQELKLSKVCEMFTPNPEPDDEFYMNKRAKVFYMAV